MPPTATRLTFLALGPLIGLVLASVAISANWGPGLFFWAAASSLALLVLTPAIQLALLSTSVLRARNAASFVLALGTVTLLATLAFYSGAFNFY